MLVVELLGGLGVSVMGHIIAQDECHIKRHDKSYIDI